MRYCKSVMKHFFPHLDATGHDVWGHVTSSLQVKMKDKIVNSLNFLSGSHTNDSVFPDTFVEKKVSHA